jgi:hypothetical protein
MPRRERAREAAHGDRAVAADRRSAAKVILACPGPAMMRAPCHDGQGRSRSKDDDVARAWVRDRRVAGRPGWTGPPSRRSAHSARIMDAGATREGGRSPRSHVTLPVARVTTARPSSGSMWRGGLAARILLRAFRCPHGIRRGRVPTNRLPAVTPPRAWPTSSITPGRETAET